MKPLIFCRMMKWTCAIILLVSAYILNVYGVLPMIIVVSAILIGFFISQESHEKENL